MMLPFHPHTGKEKNAVEIKEVFVIIGAVLLLGTGGFASAKAWKRGYLGEQLLYMFVALLNFAAVALVVLFG